MTIARGKGIVFLCLAVILTWSAYSAMQGVDEPPEESGRASGRSEGSEGLSSNEAPATTSSESNLATSSGSLAPSIRESFRKRASQHASEFELPKPPALRAPDGSTDALQCIGSQRECSTSDPFAALSWDEAQWMRQRGFVDEVQQAEAAKWTDEELDARFSEGRPEAVLELANRFTKNGERMAAKIVLQDAVRGGNVRAAHQLAEMDRGLNLPYYSRPGLEWLFVARRLGDGRVDMSYVASRFPGLRPDEIDQAMLVADRYIDELSLTTRPIDRRPGRI